MSSTKHLYGNSPDTPERVGEVTRLVSTVLHLPDFSEVFQRELEMASFSTKVNRTLLTTSFLAEKVIASVSDVIEQNGPSSLQESVRINVTNGTMPPVVRQEKKGGAARYMNTKHMEKFAAIKNAVRRTIENSLSDPSLKSSILGGITTTFLQTLEDTISLQIYRRAETVINGNPNIFLQRSPARDTYCALRALKRDIPQSELLRQAVLLQEYGPEFAKEFLEKLIHIKFTNPVLFQKKKQNKLTSRLHENILAFVDENASDLSSQEGTPKAILKAIDILTEMFQDSRMQIYIPVLIENDTTLFARIVECVKQDRIDFQILTCPDYSGEYTGEDNNQIWEFDFKNVNEGEGVVAKKAYEYVKAMHDIFTRYIANVSVIHYLPSFEFDIEKGFEGLEHLSYEDCIRKLEVSLRNIQARYKNEYNLDVQTGITNSIISDKYFKAEVKKLATSFYQEHDKFFDLVFFRRKDLYTKWHKTYDESEEAFLERMKRTIIPNQIAEYIVIGKALTSSPTSFLLASDSSIMSEAYGLYGGSPALYGEFASAVGYKE